MSGGDKEHSDVEAALLRRAQKAIDAAERIVARSEAVVGISTAVRDYTMMTRCAWCGRYHLHGHWVLLEPAPDFATSADITHGICEDCTQALRDAGMSA